MSKGSPSFHGSTEWRGGICRQSHTGEKKRTESGRRTLVEGGVEQQKTPSRKTGIKSREKLKKSGCKKGERS